MADKVRILVTAIVIGIGVYAVYLGGMHGYCEISNVETRPGGIIFDATSGNSLADDFPGWPGWPAMSIALDLKVTGVLVFAICGLMLLWLLLFTNHAKWEHVLAVLAIVLCLFGGGFKPPFLVIIAAIIGTAIRRRDPETNIKAPNHSLETRESAGFAWSGIRIRVEGELLPGRTPGSTRCKERSISGL
jgi:hypothetical protein